MRSYALVGGMLYVDLADGGIYQFGPELEIARVMGAGDPQPELIFACLDSTGAESRIFALVRRKSGRTRSRCGD